MAARIGQFDGQGLARAAGSVQLATALGVNPIIAQRVLEAA